MKFFALKMMATLLVYCVLKLQMDFRYHSLMDRQLRGLYHHGIRVPTEHVIIMDAVSIGSKTRPQYLEGQLKNWASPGSIRKFHAVTELDDANPTCTFDMETADEYIESCRGNPNFSDEARWFVDTNFGLTEGQYPEENIKRGLPGWYCAQRRTAQGLALYFQQLDHTSLPDYLVLVDDDTYFDTNGFKDHVRGRNPDKARVYAGCLFEENFEKAITWEFPYGGFGVVFSRGAIRQMMTPLFCNDSNKQSPFESNACQALAESRIDEKRFFKSGMSTVELMSNYSAFSDPMCFHSDWIIGYMINYYLSVVSPDIEGSNATTLHPIRTWPNQCGNHTLAPICNPMSGGDNSTMFCHRQRPNDFTAYQEKADMLYPAGRMKDITALREALEQLEVQLKPTKATAFVQKLKNDTIVQQPRTRPTDYYWKTAQSWFTPRQVIPESFDSDELAQVMDILRSGRIVNASSFSSSGSQLKLFLEFEGGQKAIFKPKRPFEGWDQHTGEIASFHLSRLLGFRRVPISVGRRLHVTQELRAVADPELLDTFFDDATANNCFYGTCGLCGREYAVCPDNNGYVEGVVILLLPGHLNDGSDLKIKRHINPWPYVAHSDSDREREENAKSKDYCDRVVKHKFALEPSLLDIVETSVLDFLVQNTDRHHYEYVADEQGNGAVLLFDQGKGFALGQSKMDNLKLLQPLIQCCVLRQETYDHLNWISQWDVSVSSALRDLLEVDVTSPVLIDDDFVALDRRMKIVQQALSTCIVERGHAEVLQ